MTEQVKIVTTQKINISPVIKAKNINNKLFFNDYKNEN